MSPADENKIRVSSSERNNSLPILVIDEAIKVNSVPIAITINDVLEISSIKTPLPKKAFGVEIFEKIAKTAAAKDTKTAT